MAFQMEMKLNQTKKYTKTMLTLVNAKFIEWFIYKSLLPICYRNTKSQKLNTQSTRVILIIKSKFYKQRQNR